MSDSDKNLENQILEAGEKLIDPPSSVDELLSLLDVSSLTIPLYLFFLFSSSASCNAECVHVFSVDFWIWI